MRVQNEERGTFYRCNTSSRDHYGCPHHVISASIIDRAVLDKMRLVLNSPELIAAEVARLRREDPTKPDRDAVQLRLAEIERQRGNLARRVAAIDDDDIAGTLLAEMSALSKQNAALLRELETLEAERASWEASQKRIDDLESWARVVARNIDLLDYDGRRLALDALGIEVKVWSTDHSPRYEIKMLPATGVVAVNDPLKGDDAGPFVAHVDGYIRRGCARRGGRRADRP
jgi:hypothetical protein